MLKDEYIHCYLIIIIKKSAKVAEYERKKNTHTQHTLRKATSLTSYVRFNEKDVMEIRNTKILMSMIDSSIRADAALLAHYCTRCNE